MIRFVYLIIMIAAAFCSYAIDVVAHRGFTTESVENTLDSIREAWLYEIQAVEVDIQILNDGTIVLFHDRKVGGQLLTALNYSQLQSLFPLYHIPTLEEALLEIAPGKSIILDLKSGSSKFVSELCEILKRQRSGCKVIIQSPDLRVLNAIEERLFDSVKYYFLTNLERRGILQKEPSAKEVVDSISSTNISGVIAKGKRFIDRDFVQSLQSAGVSLYIWTINEPKRVLHYANLGVDGIITDNPAAIKLIDANEPLCLTSEAMSQP